MKNLLFLGLLILSFLSCKERDTDPNVLPPATQTGANTAGCLVDGKIWVATTKYLNPLGGTYCEKINDTYYLNINLKHLTNGSVISLKSKIETLQLNKEYIIPISSDPDFDNAAYGSATFQYLVKLPNYTGKIKITRLDIPNNIVSGTFEFKAVDNEGNVVTVTDGRFDKKFD